MAHDVLTVVIVGAGPSGLAAAAELGTHAGIQVTLIDQQERPGGQYFRQPSSAPGLTRDMRERAGERTIRVSLEHDSVEFLGGYSVIGRSGGAVIATAVRGGDVHTLAADAIVVCTGAREHVRPFPGWDHPRVVTGGLLSHWLRSDGAEGIGRVLLAGSGPFLLSLAHECAKAGVSVQTTLERARPYSPSLAVGRHVLDLPRMVEGASMMAGLAIRRARPVQGAWVQHLTETSDGELEVGLGGTARGTARVDMVAVSDGFTPNTGLAAVLGAEVTSDAAGVPRIAADSMGRTSIPGIYAAGEGLGVGGHHLASLRGRLAALAVALDFERASSDRAVKAAQRKVRSAERAYAAMQGRFALGPDPLAAQTPSQTVVCRCERVTAAELAEVANARVVDRYAIRQQTRMGMGLCQGRECSRFLGEYLCGRGAGTSPPARDRFPLEPVPATALLAALEDTGE